MDITQAQGIVAQPPPIPSKWDIIPIHTSDVASFMRCRRYWDWTSPTRTNLRHRVEIHGINFPLWFGSGIHYALEMYYNPVLRRDPVEAFKTWYLIQWEGGIVDDEWLERTYDIHPKQYVNNGTVQWEVRGLRDLIPDPNTEEFENHFELGVGMMEFYKDYAEANDNFDIIACESQFSVPLGFEWADHREDSPNYGKKLEVHARGKRDAILQSHATSKFGVIDHKTAVKIDEAYFIKLDKDPQCLNYCWASQEEAKIHDLPYKRIDGVIYQGLRKAYPRPPSTLANGITPSVNRQSESTTAKMFSDYITEHGLTQWYENNEKARLYYEYLLEAGDKQFIERYEKHYNVHEVANAGEQLKLTAMDMLDSPRVYPHPTGDFLCVRCAFRAPCIAADDGSDWQDIINNNYEQNRGR